jgi:hypothetical protein
VSKQNTTQQTDLFIKKIQHRKVREATESGGNFRMLNAVTTDLQYDILSPFHAEKNKCAPLFACLPDGL